MAVTTAQHAVYRPSTGIAALRDRWTDVFRTDFLIHMAIAVSIVAGTFQGYLKDRIPGALPYALSDGFFIMAAVLWFGTLVVRRETVRGPGIVPAVLTVLILTPFIYALAPGTSAMVKLAGLRAWSAFPIACLIGMYVTRTTGHVRFYLGLVVILCVITAIYGIYQYQIGPEAAIQNPIAAERHGESIFYEVTGQERGFRAFSTFTFPAPFAGFMVFGLLAVTGRFVGGRTSRSEKLLLALLATLFFAGMTVSGTRAALITLVIGVVVIGWMGGLSIAQLMLLPLGAAVVHVAVLVTAGGFTERFVSVLLDENQLWTRVLAPITIAGRALGSDLFGLGLGRSGVGVPFQIFQSYPTGYFVGGDGDLGRAAVELGIIGVGLLVVVVATVIPYAYRSATVLLKSDSRDVALGAGAIIIALGAIIMIGSPLTTAPHGIIWWFIAGALFKLAAIHRHNTAVIAKDRDAA